MEWFNRLRYVVLLCIVVLAAQRLAAQSYVTSGTAVRLNADCFRLTTQAMFQGGSVWSQNRVDISQPFDIYLEIFLGCSDQNGADGMAFVLQPVSNQLGQSGGGLGYSGVSPSLALEIDTWQNTDVNDPAWDHVALMANGVTSHNTPSNLAGPFSVNPLAGFPNIEDCQPHSLRVSWDPSTFSFRAYIDCNLVVSYTGDIVRNIFRGNPMVYWGMTAATGGFVNEHRFCFEYISFTESPPDPAICRGQTVQLPVGTGTSFQWSPATGLSNTTISNPIASPAQTTTYTVIVTDGCGQQRFDTVTVFVDTPLIAPPPVQRSLCRGDTLRLDPPALGWRYFLNASGDTLYELRISQPGTYALRAGNLCGDVSTQLVVTPATPPSLNLTPISCRGSANGTAIVSIGSAPLPGAQHRYVWTGPGGTVIKTTQSAALSDFISGQPPGAYRVLVWDGNTGCRDTLNFVFNDPPLLSASLLSRRDLACRGVSNGVIIAQAGGGTPPYTYALNGGTAQASPQFTNLAAGSYTLVVQDIAGCTAAFSLSLSEPATALQLQLLSQRNLACHGGVSGAIQVAANGGMPPYRYALNGGSWQAGGSFSGLAAGLYSLSVQDDSACIATLQVQLSEPSPLAGGIANQVNVRCAGDSTGSVTVAGLGGVPPYQFSMQGGPWQATGAYAPLPAGLYPVSIRDDSNCVFVLPVQISQPQPLGGVVRGGRPVDCFGNASGSLVLLATGGVSPYAFSLDGIQFSARDTLDGLAAGAYTLTVRDDFGCTASFSAVVSGPAAPLSLSLLSLRGVSCLGDTNGVIRVAAAGGTPAYRYSIDGRNFSPAANFFGLSATLYTLTVRDANACTASIQQAIASPSGLSSVLDQKRDVACFGGNSGSIRVAGTGGTRPYTYSADGLTFAADSVYRQLSAGRYRSYLRDANGCLVSVAFEIFQPDSALSARITSQRHVDCHGNATGAVRVLAAGGTPPYSYSTDGLNFSRNSLRGGLPAGAYTLTVRDDSACTLQLPFQITEPPPLTAGIAWQKDIRCFGERNGGLRIAAAGGVRPWQYAIDRGPFGPDSVFLNLPAGQYVLTVRDDSACTTQVLADLREPPRLEAGLLRLKGVTCAGQADGYAVLQVQGGVPAWRYALNGGAFQTDSVLQNLGPGAFVVVVQDDSLCRDTLRFGIGEPLPLRIRLEAQDSILCYGQAGGSVSLVADGGVPAYRFAMLPGAFAATPQFGGLRAGAYRFVVQDDSACTDSLRLILRQPDTLRAFATSRDLRCFGDQSGAAGVSVTGGTGPYVLRWNSNPVQTSADAVQLAAGTYIVQVSDANGCSAADTVNISEPPPLSLWVDSLRHAHCDWPNGAAWLSSGGGVLPHEIFWVESGVIPQALFGGTYTAVLRDANGCLDTLRVQIDNTPPASPDFSWLPPDTVQILLSKAKIQFVNQSEGAVAYRWDFGDGGMSGEANPLHIYTRPGLYSVSLTAYNSFFVCPITRIKVLNIVPDGALYFPNAFSPNGDGYNDTYYTPGEGVVQYELRIFDRWGRLIITLNSPDAHWDGRMPQGGSAPEGVYTYVVRATFNSGRSLESAGTITLIR